MIEQSAAAGLGMGMGLRVVDAATVRRCRLTLQYEAHVETAWN